MSKRERDEMWELKRFQDKMRIARNRKLTRKIKHEVELQKYHTNVKRIRGGTPSPR